ncbi:aminopeptidase P family protein [Bacillus luteolus]|uniref:Aminopeptidase P family protein n=1 Tax=Litchfieldia luteola TaxID=682179 RepID=A0ABR9QJ42_9BACI|nr:Xaa-Pro peptidase family protein [Cytobacillus luteolus]MBE4908525.1 aminopeptidase P family protein [Cytobacillus luteolus]MBP1941377.1 Xaa-Pro aminopeptidase [Cytobacillus luteolus]
MIKRIEKLRRFMKVEGLDALFIYSYENRRYFSGFSGSNGYLLITDSYCGLITDQRYTEQAKEQSPSFEVVTHGIEPFKTIQEVFEGNVFSRIGFESESISVHLFTTLSSMFTDCDWVPLTKELLTLRSKKDPEEVEIIRKAIAISDQSFKELVPMISPGMTEKEVAVELEYLMGKHGHEGPAFGTIVASDTRAALPHATPSINKIKTDHFLLIDYGVKYMGYMSDMTRTLWIGSPSEELKEYYYLTHDALEKSIEAVKPGMTGHELDTVARQVFLREGLEGYSLRGLGHGIGLQIHENPRIVLNSNEVLEPGMVFTIEPGLYVPGKVGVRVEDIVLVTESGCEILTNTPRHIHI